MKKTTRGIFILAAIFVLLSISFASASDFWSAWDSNGYYNPSGSSGGSSGKYYDYSKDTWEVKHETIDERNSPWGYEKRTEIHYDKVVDETKNYLRYRDYYRWEPAISYSNWRYKEPYYAWDKEDKNDYYYRPQYDYYLGYYNWRW